MRKNWVKWIVGVGSITAFTGVTAILQDNQDKSARSQVAADTWNVDITNTDISKLDDNEKSDREQFIAGLDWEDGNWNVENTDEQATYVTPTNPYQGQVQRENRTERS